MMSIAAAECQPSQKTLEPRLKQPIY
jgi:hypothetical protein